MDKSVVIHFGKHSTIAGFSNRDLPQCVIPSAYLKIDNGEPIFGLYPLLQAEKGDIYTLFDNRGVPTDWDMLAKFWRWIYRTQLCVKPEELCLCITVPAEISVGVKEQLYELTMCKLEVPVCQLISEPLALTLALGKSTALVVDVGAAKATITPVVDGGVVKNGIMSSPYAGDFLDYQLTKSLDDEGDGSSLYCWRQSRTWMQDFKNTMLQVSPLNLSEIEKQLKMQPLSFLPMPIEGQRNFLYKHTRMVTWDLKKCYQLAESLFDPSIVSGDFDSADGLGELVTKSIKKCAASMTSNNGTSTCGSSTVGASAFSAAPEQIHAALLTNVVLVGGTSLLSGLEQRLVNELSLHFPQCKLSTYATPAHIDRQLRSWQAGVSMCHLPDWKIGYWTTKQEYLDSLDK